MTPLRVGCGLATSVPFTSSSTSLLPRRTTVFPENEATTDFFAPDGRAESVREEKTPTSRVLESLYSPNAKFPSEALMRSLESSSWGGSISPQATTQEELNRAARSRRVQMVLM